MKRVYSEIFGKRNCPLAGPPSICPLDFDPTVERSFLKQMLRQPPELLLNTLKTDENEYPSHEIDFYFKEAGIVEEIN